MLLADVSLNVPIDKTFYYIIPDEIELTPLARVQVNFAGRKLIGFVLRIVDSETVTEEIEGIKLKEIEKVIDKTPIINETLLSVARWMSDYNITPFGEVLSAITPSAKKGRPLFIPFEHTGRLEKLSPEQNSAYQSIQPSIGTNEVFLIHGITGSGKTEVYKQLVKDAMDKGLSSIILIPEIALTPQTLERFYRSFGSHVALYHSKLTQGERLGEWQRIMSGEAKIVIGPRSAVFAPVNNLGLIIIDEEHESSYKAGSSPRYHARQVAFYRAKTQNATLVLGSATPQIETYYHAINGNFHLIELKNRYGNTAIPDVEIVDLKTEDKGNKILSQKTFVKILETLQKKKQILLFLNRRGFSPSLICQECGFVFNCPNCDVTLTYHLKGRHLTCHHCGYQQDIPMTCPSCGNTAFKEIGSGTERLESLLSDHFPNEKILRMDMDTTRVKNAYRDILEEMKTGRANILIGTQMIAKGHDIAGIHLVGAILPDITLSLPDFRSSERTFILLTQVIGRAGRREDPGEAIIQTYMPENETIKTAALQDYKKFYDLEIKKREAFNYPPFVRLGRVVVRGKAQDNVEQFAADLSEFIHHRQKAYNNILILGPVSCPIEKLNNQYRYHIIFKAKKISDIIGAMREFKQFFKQHKLSAQLNLELDVDPVNLM